MEIPLHQVDAFTDRPFTGNPAAVCPLADALPEDLMQAIASENNLSETAFLVRSAGGDADYDLRWFTPTTEVDLCGHATLAAGHVVLSSLDPGAASVSFATRSGILRVEREPDGRLRMDLPADPRDPADASPEEAGRVRGILGVQPEELLGGSTWIAVLAEAGQVSDLAPDFAEIGRLDTPYLNVTAAGPPGSGIDFVSRYFAPGAGAHGALTPYWAQRLGRQRLTARQVSARGGEIDCEMAGERVLLRGRAVEVIRGAITLADPS
jgi:PhzF family phenazine biosynthesis protein